MKTVHKLSILSVCSICLLFCNGCTLPKRQFRVVDFYNKAIELQPLNAKVYFRRGFIYYQASQYHGAIDDFSSVLKIEPDNEKAYYYRGMAHFSMGNQEDAKRDFKCSEKLNPQYKYPADIFEQ